MPATRLQTSSASDADGSGNGETVAAEPDRSGDPGTLCFVGTLVCCALPALFVAVGAGATLAGLIGAAPQLVWLSEHKDAVFAVAAIMLTIAAVLRYAGRNAPCPSDPRLAASCQRVRRISGAVLYVAGGLFAVGFFFAFLAARVL